MKYRAGQIVRAPSGGTWVPRPLKNQCRRCGAVPEQGAEQFFGRWLPANQHASDTRTRAVVEVTFPFEFRCYESWGIAMYARFTFPPMDPHLATAADALSGRRFGPFQCFCEADKLVRAWFETATGDDPMLANLMGPHRAIVEGQPQEES